MQNSVLFDFALSLIADDVLYVCAFAGTGAAESWQGDQGLHLTFFMRANFKDILIANN